MLTIGIFVSSLNISLDLHIADICLIIREVLGLKEDWSIYIGSRTQLRLQRLNLKNNFPRIHLQLPRISTKANVEPENLVADLFPRSGMKSIVNCINGGIRQLLSDNQEVNGIIMRRLPLHLLHEIALRVLRKWS